LKPIIVPAARDDILRQYRYYLVEQDKPRVAERFLSAVRRTIETTIRMPQGGVPKRLSREALRGLRSWPVKGFEDLRVYYLADESGVRVVRVLHGKRDINSILQKEGDYTPQ
jgi:plasmid stabilization system protein ParE